MVPVFFFTVCFHFSYLAATACANSNSDILERMDGNGKSAKKKRRKNEDSYSDSDADDGDKC